MEPPGQTYSMRVASEIRAEVGRQRISMGDLAQHLGISRQALRNRLNGSQPFTIAEFDAIAGRLGLGPVELLLRVEDVA